MRLAPTAVIASHYYFNIPWQFQPRRLVTLTNLNTKDQPALPWPPTQHWSVDIPPSFQPEKSGVKELTLPWSHHHQQCHPSDSYSIHVAASGFSQPHHELRRRRPKGISRWIDAVQAGNPS
ncbi:hypothetical protein B0T21DRAFT_359255 [Apiosordaria backusii]|uniref:Uncharacterized protein n=1 Tax=Apiosordaria backusii TaxID=314023 RepID=A0AA40ETR1_9PEZI|nr:hypothetical protein B0T21DRAFT_359255 [Apiosordaria backusii]